MKLNPLALLKETDLQIKDGPVAGAGLRDALRRLFGQLNPYFDSVNRILSRGLTFGDNFSAEVVIAKFTHGVAQSVALKTLTQAQGAFIIGCNGAAPAAPPLVQMLQPSPGANAQPLCRVTIWFNDSSASNVSVALVLLPEGLQTSSIPTWLDLIPKALLSTTGDLIYASALGTPARLAAGALNYVLTSGGPGVAPSWAAAGGGITLPTGAVMWTKPPSPDARDEEFDGSNTWTAHAATRDGSIDPYAAITTAGHYRDSFNSYWPGWYVCQPNRSGGGDAAGLDKLLTCNTNDVIWWRWKGVQGSTGHTAGNGVRSFLIGDGPLGTPTHYCGISVNDGGAHPSVSLISDTGNSDLAVADSLSMTRIEYGCLWKLGNTTHGYVAGAGGEWTHIGSKTLSAAVTQMRAYGYNGAITVPGNPFFAFKFIRFIANSTTQLPPNY